MGIAKKNKFKTLLKSVGNGILDSIPVVSTIKSNVESDLGGKGRVDWVRLSTSVLLLVLLIAFVFGKISLEQLESLIKLLN